MIHTLKNPAQLTAVGVKSNGSKKRRIEREEQREKEDEVNVQLFQ